MLLLPVTVHTAAHRQNTAATPATARLCRRVGWGMCCCGGAYILKRRMRVYFVQGLQSPPARSRPGTMRLGEVNLEAFLEVMPPELGEQVIPAARTLQLRRVSRKARDALARMRCRVDVQPGRSIRQAYSDENATLGQRRAAVRVFVGRSLQLCMTDFRLGSFVLHGMVLDQTGSLNAMLLHSRGLEVLDLRSQGTRILWMRGPCQMQKKETRLFFGATTRDRWLWSGTACFRVNRRV
jgi:hypothetical protein